MTRRIRIVLVVTGLFISSAAPAFPQKYQNVGRAKCVNCHDHDDQKLWSEKKDGPPPNNHLNALKQMESKDPKKDSKKFAEAINLKDVYDLAGACVRCHATVVKGDISNGVTCETCHGAGSGYLEPHQKKNSYNESVALGLNDFDKKPANWATACMKCHVMDDAKLIAAGHPSGDDFDLGAKYLVVATGHWKTTNSYEKAAITAAGNAARAPLLAARKGGSAAVPTPTPAAPIASPPPATAVAIETPPRPGVFPSAPPGAAGPSASPGNVPNTGIARPAARPATATPAPSPAAVSTAPVGLPPSAKLPPPVTTPETVALPQPVLPQSPTAAVAEIQGRTILLLDSLLRRGGSAPVRVKPPERRTQYRGADAELLRLQEEVLALAIEALGTAPTPSAKPEGAK